MADKLIQLNRVDWQLPGEKWRSIADHPGYEISGYGRVRSLDRIVDCGRAGLRPVKGRILKPRLITSGYWGLQLEKHKDQLVHILVCIAFRGPKPSFDHEVAHWDDNKLNNFWKNLRWATAAENKADHIRHGRQPRGEKSHFARITADQVREVRRLHSSGTPTREIEARFGLSHTHVWQILSRKAWVHVP